MMILSRIWYFVLAILVGASIYVVSLAVGQFNRESARNTDELLKSDSQVVNWALQIDSRHRLNNLLLVSVDAGITKALKAANGKDITAAARDEGKKALTAFNDKLPPEYKSSVLFAVDRDGRIVSQIGWEGAAAYVDFELGGYPAVFDALHGFLRDDSWVLGGKLARVVARPVEDDLGQPPLGAIVAIRWVDASFAAELAKRTRTNIAFFAQDAKIASASTSEHFEEALFDQLKMDDAKAEEAKQFSDVKTLGTGGKDIASAMYVRIPGDAWELGAAFAVVRVPLVKSSPTEFISGADDKDKASVKLWLVLLAIGVGAGAGMLFSILEHSMPLREVGQQAARLKKGDIDYLQLPRFRGQYRAFAQDINAGIERVIEKGGGAARKPADLESILGPVPAQPNMSAFNFPLSGPTIAPGQQVPVVPPPVQGPPPPNAPLNAPPPPINPPFVPPKPLSNPPPPYNPAAPGPRLPVEPKAPPPVHAPPAPPAQEEEEDEDERTMIAQPSAAISAPPGGAGGGEPSEASDWLSVYDDYVRTKKQCNEPIDGLTFDKFQQTLKKNRDALMQRHGVKRVKFSVYIKEGKASLKATPVRE